MASLSMEKLVERFLGPRLLGFKSRSRTLRRKKGFWAEQKTPILC